MRLALFLIRRGTSLLVGLAEMPVGQRQAVTIIDIVGKRLAFGGKFPFRRSWQLLPGSQRVENAVQRRICTPGELPATAAMDCVVPHGLVLRTIHL